MDGRRDAPLGLSRTGTIHRVGQRRSGWLSPMYDGVCVRKGFDTKFAKEREGRQEDLFWTFGQELRERGVKTPFALLRGLGVDLLPQVPVLRRKALPVIAGNRVI